MGAAASSRDNRVFRYALLFSLAVHGVALLTAPHVSLVTKRVETWPAPIAARLAEPAPTPAAAEPQPEPQKPQPPKPVAKQPPAPKPVPSPIPAPPVAPPVAQSEPPPAAPPAAPQAETGPAGASAPPRAEAPRGESLQTLIDRYAVDLKGEIAKRIEYPMVARQEGWQGKGEVLLQIGANGAIADIRIVRTSGYALLDRAVIDGVRQAHAQVPLFPELRGRAFPVAIPFELNLTAR